MFGSVLQVVRAGAGVFAGTSASSALERRRKAYLSLSFQKVFQWVSNSFLFSWLSMNLSLSMVFYELLFYQRFRAIPDSSCCSGVFSSLVLQVFCSSSRSCLNWKAGKFPIEPLKWLASQATSEMTDASQANKSMLIIDNLLLPFLFHECSWILFSLFLDLFDLFVLFNLKNTDLNPFKSTYYPFWFRLRAFQRKRRRTKRFHLIRCNSKSSDGMQLSCFFFFVILMLFLVVLFMNWLSQSGARFRPS